MDYYRFFLIFFGCHHVNSLFITRIEIPEIVDFRDQPALSCRYNLGTHKLNSVKWYKDGMEFFRYSPMMHPVFMTFNVAGITTINEKFYCNGDSCSIELSHLSKQSSGTYRCEVSGDAPEFKLTSKTANMTVAALPKHDPVISGVSSTYHLYDFVVANCSSDWSSLPSSLQWYINDEKAPKETLQPQIESSNSQSLEFNLFRRSLEIRFYIDRKKLLYSHGTLKLQCIADINQREEYSRATTKRAVIFTDDKLANEKYVNSGSKTGKTLMHVFMIEFFIFLLSKSSQNIFLFFHKIHR